MGLYRENALNNRYCIGMAIISTQARAALMTNKRIRKLAFIINSSVNRPPSINVIFLKKKYIKYSSEQSRVIKLQFWFHHYYVRIGNRYNSYKYNHTVIYAQTLQYYNMYQQNIMKMFDLCDNIFMEIVHDFSHATLYYYYSIIKQFVFLQSTEIIENTMIII